MMIIEKIFGIGRAQYGPGACLGPRQTIGFEFVRVLKGQVIWNYDEAQYQAKPGDWILSQPEHYEHYFWDRHNQTQHDHIHFTLTSIPSDFPNPEHWPVLVSLDAGNMMQALFEQIITLNRSSHNQRTMLMKMTVQQMLYYWVYQGFEITEVATDIFSDGVQRVMDAVQKNWNKGTLKPLSMEKMIRIACISRSSFLRNFYEQCNETPNRFFENQRLYLARLHLLKSNRTIEQIADLLGYSSPFHFSKNFKQLFACSPKDFRKHIDHDHKTIDDYVFQKVFSILSSTQTL